MLLLIYKGTSGDSRAKEELGCIINKKYKRIISERIGATERIFRVKLQMKENITIIVTYGSNEYEIAHDRMTFRKN